MNQNDAPREPVQPSQIKSTRRRWVTTIVLFMICAGIVWSLMPDSTLPPQVTILPSNYSIKAPPLPVPDRWIPMSWGWLWKLRYALLGKPVTVDIDTEMIRFREPRDPPVLAALGGRAPLASSNGVLAWILSDEELKALGSRRELEPDSERHRSRMSLGAGVLATMSMTTSPQIRGVPFTVGNTVNYAVGQRADSLELTGALISTEVVTNTHLHSSEQPEIITLQTNFALAARMQIPRGHGVFLYETNGIDSRRRSTGLLIRLKVK